MKGIELAKGYFAEYGLPMLRHDFPEYLPYLAVGTVGPGSENFGYDDLTSRDHDFEPGFTIFLPGRDIIDDRTEFLLERAYAKLPKEYMGVPRLTVAPVGGSRHGVRRISDFYLSAVGSPNGILTPEQWLTIPDHALAEAVNGEVFYDEYGLFSEIRSRIMYMPEDIRLKRLAGNLLLMAQSGQYNFLRCIDHREASASQLACFEFTRAAMRAFFLLSGRYMPFYKWSFRALCELKGGAELAELLEILICRDASDPDTVVEKVEAIDNVASLIISRLQDESITNAVCTDLEKHAYSVNDHIKDANIRNMNIFSGV